MDHWGFECIGVKYPSPAIGPMLSSRSGQAINERRGGFGPDIVWGIPFRHEQVMLHPPDIF
jgi:hypothetical protein